MKFTGTDAKTNIYWPLGKNDNEKNTSATKGIPKLRSIVIDECDVIHVWTFHVVV